MYLLFDLYKKKLLWPQLIVWMFFKIGTIDSYNFSYTNLHFGQWIWWEKKKNIFNKKRREKKKIDLKSGFEPSYCVNVLIANSFCAMPTIGSKILSGG